MGSNAGLTDHPLARTASIGPIVLGVFLLAVAWSLLSLERQRAEDEIRDEVEVTAEQIAARLSVWLDDRLSVLEQFARMRGAPEFAGEDAFRREAGILIERVRGFEAINWVDASGVVRLAEPAGSMAAALGRDLSAHPHPDVRRAVLRSLRTMRPSRTPWIDLDQGGTGFAVYWPVQSVGAAHGGLVNGVFDLDTLLGHALPDLSIDVRHALAFFDENGSRVFGVGDLDGPGAAFQVDQVISFVDSPLRLVLQPRTLPAGKLLGAPYVLLLIASVVLSVVVALLLRGYLLRHEALSRQEGYTRLLLDSTSEGLLGVDLLGRCTFCNAAGLALLGLEDDESLVGKPGLGWIVDSSAARERAITLELFSAIREGRIFETREARAWRPDGSQFDLTLATHPIEEKGRLTGALVSFSDVTLELGEAERAQRLTAVLLRVPEMVALLDMRGRLVFVNPAARSVLELGDGPCERIDAHHLVEPASADQQMSAMFRSVSDQDHWQGEITLHTASGEAIPAHVVVMRHRDRHGDAYYSAIARDLREDRRADAERQALEEQFREAQRTESLGLLAGSIAHDFNNMLVGVLGNASLALEHLERDSAAFRHVVQVQTATEHAAELVGQLLAYSGRGRFQAHTVDAGRIVEEMAGLLRTSVPRRITLELECTARHGVVADATQIRQLMMNLVTNAADAIAESGCVSVSVTDEHWDPACDDGQTFFAPSEAGDYVRLRIEDDGDGMPDHVLSRIFEPFFTTKEEGKGLGLAAVLGIVRGHGGFLRLGSVPGAGTTFDVHLPRSAAGIPEPARPVQADPKPPETVEGRVLLVDDEAGVRQYLEAALDTLGLSVLSCEDGEEGVRAFEAHHEELALVLMDQSMPGLSGDAAWERMREIAPDVPGLLMSGYDEVRIEQSVQDLGFTGFLHKPFRFKDLREAVQGAIARRQLVS